MWHNKYFLKVMDCPVMQKKTLGKNEAVEIEVGHIIRITRVQHQN